MNTNTELSTPLPVRNSDPVTSFISAVEEEDVVEAYKRRIAECLAAHPEGLTQAEISMLTQIPEPTCSPRLRPMARHGIIVPDGKRRNKTTDKLAIIWKLGGPEDAITEEETMRNKKAKEAGKVPSLKPMSPVQFTKEMEALDNLFNLTTMKGEEFDALKRSLVARLNLYSQGARPCVES